MSGIEHVYQEHHKSRGSGFAILIQERGAFLRRHIGTGKTILDIGCRDGELTAEFAEGNTVTGADVDPDALKRAREKLSIETIHADLNEDWSFPKRHYDVVVASEFLEHIYFPGEVLKKIRAVLKDDGMFAGTIPHAYSMQSRVKFLLAIKEGTPLQDPTHINHFSYTEFCSLLREEFDILEIKGLTPPRYRFLAKLFPYAFAHDLLFCVRPKHS